jgi:hypothetical protein
MKDLSTGKTHLTRRTKEVAGPVFAKAGYNVENLVEERQILKAWTNTLSDTQADDLLGYLTGNSPPQHDVDKPDPSPAKLRLVK